VSERSFLRGLAALCGLVLLIYAPVWGASALSWDDVVWLEDPALELPWGPALWRAWLGVHDGVVYPGLRAAWWVERWLTGPELPAAHAVELGLFVGLVGMVGRLALRWFGAGAGVGLAVAAWALAPQQVESVAWLTSRKDLLAVTLLVGALTAEQAGWRRLGSALLLVGVLVKPPVWLVAVALVGLAVAAGGSVWRSWAPALTLGALVLGWSAALSVGSRLEGAAVTELLGRGLRLQGHWHLAAVGGIAPAAVYPEPAGAALLGIGAMCSLGWVAWLRWGPGARSLRCAWAALWWLPLLPYGGPLEMAFWGADRHLLVPLAGLVGAIAMSLVGLEGRGRLLRLLLVGWVGWSAARSAVRVPAWRDDLALWGAEQRRPGEHWARPFQLGMALAKRGAFGDAAEAFVDSYRLRPADETAARLIVARLAAERWDAERHRVASTLVTAPGDARGWMEVSEALFGLGAREAASFAFEHCRARWGAACQPVVR
jgi:hypothetical protein